MSDLHALLMEVGCPKDVLEAARADNTHPNLNQLLGRAWHYYEQGGDSWQATWLRRENGNEFYGLYKKKVADFQHDEHQAKLHVTITRNMEVIVLRRSLSGGSEGYYFGSLNPSNKVDGRGGFNGNPNTQWFASIITTTLL